jgi:hypothetical protein
MSLLSRALLLCSIAVLGCGSPPADPAGAPAPTEATAPPAPVEAPAPAAAPEPAPAAEAPEDCCCEYNSPAGAGLLQFDREQGACEGAFYFRGCVDSGVCDVADLPAPPLDELGKVTVAVAEGVSAEVPAAKVFAHSQTVLFVPQPREAVLARWKADLEGQGWSVEVTAEPATEAHGALLTASRGETRWSADLAGECQGSKGTCAYLDEGLTAR